MNRSVPWLAAVLLLAAITFVAFVAPARSQIQATPSYQSVGVSQAGGSSTAWFHEPSSRTVIACQSAATATAPAIQCATAKLP